jgi:hypothetical protein
MHDSVVGRHLDPLVHGEVVTFQRHRMDTPLSHAIHAISVRAGTASIHLLTLTLEN